MTARCTVNDHTRCPDQLHEGMAPIEITVSTEPPIVAGSYISRPFTCPHGVSYWIKPTGELTPSHHPYQHEGSDQS